MRVKVQHRGEPGSRRSLGRAFVSLLILLFFTTQSFLVQTHLHGLPDLNTGATAAHLSVPLPQQAPVDADKCLLCQEFSHNGVFLLPAGLAVLLPSAAASLLPFALVTQQLVHGLSHAWQGRAPPTPV